MSRDVSLIGPQGRSQVRIHERNRCHGSGSDAVDFAPNPTFELGPEEVLVHKP
jgi:hypothetical protein